MTNEVDGNECAKQGCNVSTSGVCVDGRTPLQACPYYGNRGEAAADAHGDEGVDIEQPEVASGDDQVGLPSGEALTVSDVDELLRWRDVTLIAIVGDRDSGKTTLLCALYDRFLKGPFGDRLFAGSRTVVMLERRSHYSRAESGRAEPDTIRTPISEGLQFVHLSLAPRDSPASRIELALSDRAGEVYQRARNNSSIVADLIEVPRADRLVLLLDGGRVANPPERAGAMQAVRQTLRALSDGGALSASSVVQVVTTKVDLLADHPEKVLIEEQIGAFRRRLVSDFSSRCRELNFWEIAARDPRGRLAPAHGLEPLLREWTVRRSRPISPAHLGIAVKTELDRLLIRARIEELP